MSNNMKKMMMNETLSSHIQISPLHRNLFFSLFLLLLCCPLFSFNNNIWLVFQLVDSQLPVNEKPFSDSVVKRELLLLTLPALAGQAIDPVAQLMETAYIGRLGTVELAYAGVSITTFNIASKLFNIPLLSIATSFLFLAEDIAKTANQDSASENDDQQNSGNGTPLKGVSQRKQLPSVSTALLLALRMGIFEALALYPGSGTHSH